MRLYSLEKVEPCCWKRATQLGFEDDSLTWLVSTSTQILATVGGLGPRHHHGISTGYPPQNASPGPLPLQIPTWFRPSIDRVHPKGIRW